MLLYTTHELMQLVHMWIWPFFRIAGLLMTAPIIGTRSVPIKIRLVLALAITIVIFPVIPAVPTVAPLSGEGILITMQQVITGLAMGLSVRVIFIALQVAGQAIGQLMGLMLASMVDPLNGNQVPIIGQFYLLLSTLLFLTVDGHLIMIRVLAVSSITVLALNKRLIPAMGLSLSHLNAMASGLNSQPPTIIGAKNAATMSNIKKGEKSIKISFPDEASALKIKSSLNRLARSITKLLCISSCKEIVMPFPINIKPIALTINNAMVVSSRDRETWPFLRASSTFFGVASSVRS